jgi:hypothetical protein
MGKGCSLCCLPRGRTGTPRAPPSLGAARRPG